MELVEELNLSPTSINHTLAVLYDLRMISKQGTVPNKRARPSHIWALTGSGRHYLKTLQTDP